MEERLAGRVGSPSRASAVTGRNFGGAADQALSPCRISA